MKKLVALAWIMIAGLLPQSGDAADQSVAGSVAYVSGEATLLRGSEQLPLSFDQLVLASDSIVTGESGRVRLSMRDGSTIYVGRMSRISLTEYRAKSASSFSGLIGMLWGKARFVVSHLKSADASFSVKTSTAVLGVRGTDFIVSLELPANAKGRLMAPGLIPDPMPTTALLQDGRISVQPLPRGGEIMLKPGQIAMVGTDGKVTVRPYTPQELQLLQGDLDGTSPAAAITPPVVEKPKVTVPVVVQPPSIQWGTQVIQNTVLVPGAPVRGKAAPPKPVTTTTTIQVPVAVQPPVITQVPAN